MHRAFVGPRPSRLTRWTTTSGWVCPPHQIVVVDPEAAPSVAERCGAQVEEASRRAARSQRAQLVRLAPALAVLAAFVAPVLLVERGSLPETWLWLSGALAPVALAIVVVETVGGRRTRRALMVPGDLLATGEPVRLIPLDDVGGPPSDVDLPAIVAAVRERGPEAERRVATMLWEYARLLALELATWRDEDATEADIDRVRDAAGAVEARLAAYTPVPSLS